MISKNFAFSLLVIVALARDSYCICESPLSEVVGLEEEYNGAISVPENAQVGDIIWTFLVTEPSTVLGEVRTFRPIAPLEFSFTGDQAIQDRYNRAFYFTTDYVRTEESNTAYVHVHIRNGFADLLEIDNLVGAFSPRFGVLCPYLPETANAVRTTIYLHPSWNITITAVNNRPPVFDPIPTVQVDLKNWNSTHDESGLEIKVVTIKDADSDFSHAKALVSNPPLSALNLNIARASFPEEAGDHESTFTLSLLATNLTGIHAVTLFAHDENAPTLTDEITFYVNIVDSGAIHQVGTLLMVVFFAAASTFLSKY